ncbi:MAG: amino acid adenylation domain-containing protein [Chloroflexota bacterium]
MNHKTETVSDLLARLTEANIKLWAEGDRLRYDAPAQAMTPDVIDILRNRKPDIIAFFETQAEASVREEKIGYWQKQLADASPLLKLPIPLRGPQPYEPAASGTVSTCAFALPGALCEDLHSLSLTADVPLSTLVSTAFSTLLFRYSGQTDVIFGLHTGDTGGDAAVGPIPVRLDLAGNPSFQRLLVQANDTITAGQQQALPLAALTETVDVETFEEHHPIFQTLLTWETDAYRPTSDVPAPDLQLELYEDGTEILGQWHYRPDRIDDGTAQRLGGHLQTLLAGVVADANNTVERLPLLTADEREMMLVEWNRTEADYDLDTYVHQLFEARVVEAPDSVAVRFGDAQLTYHELNVRANQLSHHLIELGIGREDLVGVFVERSLDVVVAMLAIFKAGGVYLPLDPAYPPERLAFMLEDTQAAVLLTKEKWMAQLPPHQAKVIVLDADQALLAEKSTENPNRSVEGNDLAYVIYTSGSTGLPKGVSTEYRSLTNYIHNDIKYLHLSPADRMTQFFSLSFDASVAEILVPICAGARLYVMTEEQVLHGPALLTLIKNEAITYLFLTPTVMATFATVNPNEFPALRAICAGGENCTPDLVRHWWTPTRRFYNIYGPTEFTMAATLYECTPHDAPAPIGHIYDNCQAYVLDEYMEPVPIGVAGELYLGGVQVARGYFNRPELTAEKFVPNPFGPAENPGRLYKTGDLVTFRKDRMIVFVGREDGMVKVRGLRIELGEIEAALNEHPDVQQVVVDTVKDESGRDQQLVAYVVPIESANGRLTAAELGRFASEKLPAYMSLSAYVFLSEFPLTPNGKVDRRALPDPNMDSLEDVGRIDSSTPQSETEKAIAAIWCELLELDQVGIDENFFELGGHSVLVTQVFSRLKNAFHVTFAIRELFESTTIAEIAEMIDAKTLEQADDDLLAQLLQEVDAS